MKRRCGNCKFGDPNGENQVFCFGVPPHPMEVVPDGKGGTNIKQQMPLLPTDRPGCALHRYRLFKRKAA